MVIFYDWNKNEIDIQRNENNEIDIEIFIRILDPGKIAGMEAISNYFDENNILTDVFIYAYENQEYKVVVRKDFYVDFMIALFKYRLINKIEWV
ncbi:MAG: hypothetical protein RLZZ267_1180 [Bacillota bacterium]|jgi:hypothetical protein